MVECFINRPEYSKEQRIDSLELLGATIANDADAYDIEKAFSFMKRGMEERYEDHVLCSKRKWNQWRLTKIELRVKLLRNFLS